MEDQKLVVFDTISELPIARQLYLSLKKTQDVIYFDTKAIPHKSFYKVRGFITQYFIKMKLKEFYYYPRLVTSKTIEEFKKWESKNIVVIKHIFYLIDVELLKTLKQKLNLKLYLWDTDSVFFFADRNRMQFFIQQELPLYDHVFTYSDKMKDFFAGFMDKNKITWLPHASAPLALTKEDKKYDICFFGIPDARRLIFLERLRDYNIVIYGKRWRKYRSIITDKLWSKIVLQDIWQEDLYQLVHQSKIILDIGRSWAALCNTGITLRVFEVLALQGFLLTNYCEELAKLFIPEEEIETFYDADELCQKVKFYLENKELREKIAQQGHQKFMKKHTWEARTQELLDSLYGK